MPLPKLSPLQSRLAASLMGSIMLLMLYLAFSSPHFAYAADVDSILPEDHNHERLLDTTTWELDSEDLDTRAEGYIAEFIGHDRSIIGRVASTDDATALVNNKAVTKTVQQGETVQFSFLNASLWGALSPQASGLPSPIQLQPRGVEQADDESNESKEGDEGDEGDGVDDQDPKLPSSLGGKDEGLIAPRIMNSTIQPRQSTSTSTRTMYITVNVCTQPGAKNSNLESPTQLQLYVSQSESNKNPGPGQDASTQQAFNLVGGAAMVTLNATGDIYIGLTGANLTENYTGSWSAQIAASIDAPYHTYDSAESNLIFVDGDSGAALLVTKDLTDNYGTTYNEWLDLTPPFTMFASKTANTSIQGLQYSYCGLENAAEIAGTTNGGQSTGKVKGSMTTTGADNFPKQQLYFEGLSPGTSYSGMLAMNGNATALGREGVGGGGQVWKAVTFSTLSDGNCAVIYNLSFCNEVAYAVPSNPTKFPNTTALAQWYDDTTNDSYQYFRKALAQVPCNTTAAAQYSLAQNCTSCAAAYKSWLCSVSIPRCTDFSSNLAYVQPRAMGQSFPNNTKVENSLMSVSNASYGSRNPTIDTAIVPGPYKEILPCDDLCYGIVRACPAVMGFGCPSPGDVGFNQSYGMRKLANESGQVTCNYPGATYDQSSGNKGPSPKAVVFATTILSMALMLSGI